MQTTDKLQITTPSEREVVMTRVFDATRQLVFDAWTKPELLRRWLTANGRELAVCEVDLRIGGAMHMVWRAAGKKDVGLRGIYREVAAPERLVHTESWEDWPTSEVTVTTLLTERDGKTTVTGSILYPSQEVRDAVLKAVMAKGAAESHDNLEVLLAELLAEAAVTQGSHGQS